mgnify:FL=1
MTEEEKNNFKLDEERANNKDDRVRLADLFDSDNEIDDNSPKSSPQLSKLGSPVESRLVSARVESSQGKKNVMITTNINVINPRQ